VLSAPGNFILYWLGPAIWSFAFGLYGANHAFFTFLASRNCGLREAVYILTVIVYAPLHKHAIVVYFACLSPGT
jgi:hypothetical protein